MLVDVLQAFLFSSPHDTGSTRHGSPENRKRNRRPAPGDPESFEKPGGGGAGGGGNAPSGQRRAAPEQARAGGMVPRHRRRHGRRRHPPRAPPRSLSSREERPDMTLF